MSGLVLHTSQMGHSPGCPDLISHDPGHVEMLQMADSWILLKQGPSIEFSVILKQLKDPFPWIPSHRIAKILPVLCSD